MEKIAEMIQAMLERLSEKQRTPKEVSEFLKKEYDAQPWFQFLYPNYDVFVELVYNCTVNAGQKPIWKARQKQILNEQGYSVRP